MAGLSQLFKSKEEKQASVNEGLKESFEALKEKDIEKAAEYRIINTALIVGCGCGGSTKDLHLVIPNDDNADEAVKFVNGVTHNGRYDFDGGELGELTLKFPNVKIKEGHFHGDSGKYNPSSYSDYV